MTGLRPQDTIQAVLEAGRKDNTYKMALLRAIIDELRERPAATEFPLSIPVLSIAQRWAGYYWPILVQDPLPQGTPKRSEDGRIREDVSFAKDLRRLRDEFAAGEVRVGTAGNEVALHGGGWAMVADQLAAGARIPPEVEHVLLRVRDAVVMPVVHLHTDLEDHPRLFDFIIAGENANDRKMKNMPRLSRDRGNSLAGLLRAEQVFLTIEEGVYRALVQDRFLLRRAILATWAEFMDERKPDARRTLARLTEDEAIRQRGALTRYRQFYSAIGLRSCTWCGTASRGGFDVDHILPWSRYPVDRFWNLVPACASCNRGQGGKSHAILRWSPQVARALEEHLTVCLNHPEHPVISTDREFLERGTPATARDLTRLVERLNGELARSALKHWSPPVRNHG